MMKVNGLVNPADLGTKALPEEKIVQLLKLMGCMYLR